MLCQGPWPSLKPIGCEKAKLSVCILAKFPVDVSEIIQHASWTNEPYASFRNGVTDTFKGDKHACVILTPPPQKKNLLVNICLSFDVHGPISFKLGVMIGTTELFSLSIQDSVTLTFIKVIHGYE